MSFFEEELDLQKWIKEDREKCLQLFLEYEYGFFPLSNETVTYQIVDTKVLDEILIQKIEMDCKGHKMYFALYLPSEVKSILKTFVTLVHPLAESKANFFEDYKSINSFCPIKDIIKRGFAVALVSAKTIAEDVINGKETGIFKVCNNNVTSNTGGVLSAWSWGCSKVMDYLETRPEIDSSKVAIIGHSRGGKTALLTGALDSRFILSISNNSGNSGAALSRGNTGETIKDITTNFPYWFCENYKQYAQNENKLPFDQHMLIGLQAPRYCYIASASNDHWADPYGELQSAVLASKYYEMYGCVGLNVPNEIELDVSYNGGRIAYHRRKGDHALTSFDWDKYMDFFDKIIK